MHFGRQARQARKGNETMIGPGDDMNRSRR